MSSLQEVIAIHRLVDPLRHLQELPVPHREMVEFYLHRFKGETGNRERSRSAPVFQRYFQRLSVLRFEGEHTIVEMVGAETESLFGSRRPGFDIAHYVGKTSAADYRAFLETALTWRAPVFASGMFVPAGAAPISFLETVLPLGLDRLPYPTFMVLTTVSE